MKESLSNQELIQMYKAVRYYRSTKPTSLNMIRLQNDLKEELVRRIFDNFLTEDELHEEWLDEILEKST